MTEHPRELSIANYHYDLTEDRIAKYPLDKRDDSKLLIYKECQLSQSRFNKIDDFLPKNSLLIFNETKVIQARLQFFKESGAKIEIFCLEAVEPVSEIQLAFQQTSDVVWKCFIGNAKKWKSGKLKKLISSSKREIEFCAERVGMIGEAHLVKFTWSPSELPFSELLALSGLVPLPPYLNREAEKSDKERYQTIYAQHDGSVAAPTAGLHFTDEVFESLEAKNIRKDKVVLHVGAGTFKPVSTEQIGDHEMHTEKIVVQLSTIKNLMSDSNEHIIVVGTTTVRTLESLYWFGVKLIQDQNEKSNLGEAGQSHFSINQWDPYKEKYQLKCSTKEVLTAVLDFMEKEKLSELHGETQLMIAPGYDFKIADILITNFHQPQSTLLLLVSAFIGESWKTAYQFALDNEFRFLSYGDSCLFFKHKEI